jgi:hypothetical protein
MEDSQEQLKLLLKGTTAQLIYESFLEKDVSSNWMIENKSVLYVHTDELDRDNKPFSNEFSFYLPDEIRQVCFASNVFGKDISAVLEDVSDLALLNALNNISGSWPSFWIPSVSNSERFYRFLYLAKSSSWKLSFMVTESSPFASKPIECPYREWKSQILKK